MSFLQQTYLQPFVVISRGRTRKSCTLYNEQVSGIRAVTHPLTEQVLQNCSPWISNTNTVKWWCYISNQKVLGWISKPVKMTESGSTCLEEHLNIFPYPHPAPLPLQSDLNMIVTRRWGLFAHWELRNTSSHACLIQYTQELDSDEKVGNDESCHVYSLQIPFIPVPNTCKLPMIPTVKWKQQIWLCQALSCGVCLLAACWAFTVGGTGVFRTPLGFQSRWG